MNHIRIEMINNGKAVLLGELPDFLPPGSLSSDEPDGTRRIFMFGWRNDELGVWESTAGYDISTTAVRGIGTIGLDKLSDLTEPYTLTIHKGGRPQHIRITACLTSTPNSMANSSTTTPENNNPATNAGNPST